MEVVIHDGTGDGKSARVDANKRISALAVSQALSQAAAQEGDTYNLNTGTISLTTALKSAVAYFENQSTKILVIPTIGFLLGNSTGGAGDLNLEVILNPRSGTIVTNAVPVDIFKNKNAGSSKTFTILELKRFKGVEGDTITDGTPWFATLLPGAARLHTINTGDIVLPPGGSLGINITPQAANTAMDLQIFMSIVDISDVIL